MLVWTDDGDGLVFQEIMNGSVERAVYIGHDAQHMRGVLALKYPIRNGVVRNWDEMEMVSADGRRSSEDQVRSFTAVCLGIRCSLT